jgi:AcrR family transcriptional regulator
MADIAREAGVAVQTLDLSFASKVAVMSAAFDIMIVGDDEPVPVIERSWYAVMRDEPDAARALSVFLRISSEIMERVYPLYPAMLAASATTQSQQSLLEMAH